MLMIDRIRENVSFSMFIMSLSWVRANIIKAVHKARLYFVCWKTRIHFLIKFMSNNAIFSNFKIRILRKRDLKQSTTVGYWIQVWVT
jgi:hypothetical protein